MMVAIIEPANGAGSSVFVILVSDIKAIYPTPLEAYMMQRPTILLF